MRVIFAPHITRQMVKENREMVFVYGDNAYRQGYGGQAAEMRGEPNTIGIATKHKPDMLVKSFFSDNDGLAWALMISDCGRVTNILDKGYKIIVPEAGLGTGFSKLPEKAPKMYGYLYKFFQLANPTIPWQKPLIEWTDFTIQESVPALLQ